MGVEFPQPAGQSEFQFPSARDKITSDKEDAMEAFGNRPAAEEESVLQMKPTPRVSGWLWSPWYAKLLWALAAVYWIGFYAMMLVPAGSMSSFVSGAMILLVFLFNPVTVIAILGFGFLKAKVAIGDWVIGPGQPIGSAIDPYTDPADARSGIRHLRHIGVIRDRR